MSDNAVLLTRRPYILVRRTRIVFSAQPRIPMRSGATRSDIERVSPPPRPSHITVMETAPLIPSVRRIVRREPPQRPGGVPARLQTLPWRCVSRRSGNRTPFAVSVIRGMFCRVLVRLDFVNRDHARRRIAGKGGRLKSGREVQGKVRESILCFGDKRFASILKINGGES